MKFLRVKPLCKKSDRAAPIRCEKLRMREARGRGKSEISLSTFSHGSFARGWFVYRNTLKNFSQNFNNLEIFNRF